MNGKRCRYSPRATLAAVGLKLQALGLLAPHQRESEDRAEDDQARAARQTVMMRT